MLRMFILPGLLRVTMLLVVAATPAKFATAQPTPATQPDPATQLSPARAVDFGQAILPIFQRHCLDCHASETAESQLRLDSMLGALRGGDSGEATIVPGDSLRSHLIQRVTATEAALRMPPDNAPPLDSSELALLQKWIDDRASWQPVQQELDQQVSTHWSFQPLRRPPVPTSALSHPIDAFIAEKLQRQNLELSPRSEPRRLLRRLYLVMHGLPPTPEDVQQFVADRRPEAWEAAIEQCLASPHYGERWAMHWLDLIRFGETDGFETNRERPNAYHFRDWVISALNDDLPYDQFIRQQLAGDALGTPVATGFLVAGPNDIVKGQDKLLGLMQRQDELSDMVNTTGTAFLGLTTGCARCHNHKFDPISQTDFYALQAIFAGVEFGESQLPLTTQQTEELARLNAQIEQAETLLKQLTGVQSLRSPVNARENVEQLVPRSARYVRFSIQRSSGGEPCLDELQVFSGAQNVALASHGTLATSSGDFVHPLHKLEHINDGQYGNPRSWIAASPNQAWVQLTLPEVTLVDRIVWGRDRQGQFKDRLPVEYRIELSIDAQQWEVVASSADRQSPTHDGEPKYNLQQVADADRPAAEEAWQSWQSSRQAKQKLLAQRQAFTGKFVTPPAIQRLFRGDPTAPREVVAPGVIAALGPLNPPLDQASDQQRRLALADWIAKPTNPLTARVMVNRLWQFHFGTGLVDTPSDFGANGSPPSHPELLDWLAVEFIEHGWSIKYMQRLILTSHTWQQSSAPRAEGLAVDAQSRWLWRFPPRRLEAEPIRDLILVASGRLDRRTGGPGFSAFEVELENVRHYFPKQDYGPADWRRMIYMTKVRQEKDSVFGVFDCPDASQVTPKRSRSTTPLQALNLLNSRFVLQQAELLADRLQHEAEETTARIQLAWQWCYGRTAEPEEVAAAAQFVGSAGWSELTRALLNSNEFVFIP